jgi:hypothetical protein
MKRRLRPCAVARLQSRIAETQLRLTVPRIVDDDTLERREQCGTRELA